jgi:3-oxoacyl-[acyl-carrier-protein] synthase II
MARFDENTRVAITGYGAICSLGNSSEEIWDALMNYQVGYRRYQLDGGVAAKFFGFMDKDQKRYKAFPKSLTKLLPEFARNALVAAKGAIEMAFGPNGGMDDHYGPFERGVIIGTGWGGLDQAIDNHADFRDTGLASSFSTLMSMSNAATAGVSMNWNMRGYQNSPIAACATGTMAIGDAYEIIRSGRAQMMIAGASESLKHGFNVWSIDIIQALSKEQDDIRRACCPFSKLRSGFVLSEGAAVLCLENFESARARGAKILAEITGYGNCTDAFDMTAPADDMQSRITALKTAMQRARKTPEQVDYINAHGTSTPINDVNESESIKGALGDWAYQIPISSTKSYTGHLIGAAGSLEAIFCLKAIETGTIPATIHLDEADPACDLNYVANRHLVDQKIDVAVNLSFGFGGSNASPYQANAGTASLTGDRLVRSAPSGMVPALSWS